MKDSVWFGAFVVLVVASVLGILVSPLSVTLRTSIIAFLVVFGLAFIWHRQRSNWEYHARRRAVSALFILGSLLIAKALVSQIAQQFGVTGNLSTSGIAPKSIRIQILTAITNSPWQLDLGLAIIGLVGLISILFFLNRLPSRAKTADLFGRQNGLADLEIRARKYTAIDTYDSDLPPLIDIWVGRNSELTVLHDMPSGVIAITGIGGQGKSALAATYLQNLREKNDTMFWDWRDCREQADRFRTQLLSAIQHVTSGEVTATEIANEDIQWLCSFFFRKAAGTKGLIVFDNVDHYVDVGESLFTSAVSTFVNEALRVDHQLLVIFTCRPRINYPSIRFREIYLRGLDLDEAMALFDKKIPGGLRDDQKNNIRTIHSLTKGHPLWLNIIAAQIGRKPESSDLIVQRLQASTIDDQSRSMLRGIWSTLHDRQKKILIYMAELPRSFEAELIYEYCGGTVGKHNRFDRAFQGLKAISLITEKAAGDSEARRYELHPLVRAFVKSEYRNKTERQDYLDLLLRCCDSILVNLMGDDQKTMTNAVLEQLTTKAELELARGNLTDCMDTLLSYWDQMVVRGVVFEFVRIGKLVMDSTEWDDESIVDNDSLDDLIARMAKTMTEIGLSDTLAPYLDLYAASVRYGTARFIGLCSIMTYVAWFNRDYESALEWGERGENLKIESGLDTHKDTSHNLALARRDSGDVDRALEYFCRGESVQNILTDDHRESGRDASFYGNIGRCLALRGEPQDALILYAKSYDLLEADSDAEWTRINIGYAANWIADALAVLGEPDEAHMFYQHAYNVWMKRAPKRAEGLERKLIDLEKDDVRVRSTKAPDALALWCSSWIKNRL